MKPFEWFEYLYSVGRVEPDAIVRDFKYPVALLNEHGDVNLRMVAAPPILNRIAYKVLQ